jgi:Heterokaryon incompatibility protein (HET)
MERSIYSPLTYSNREIRIVTISPSVEKSAPIECTTSEISLDKTPGYYALSYCWGDPSITAPMHIDGVEVQVTANLDVALRHFRAAEGELRDKRPQMRWWIDAICINQSDLDERSQQVQLMGDIYSGASRVVVWLGEEAKMEGLRYKRYKDYLRNLGIRIIRPVEKRH